MKFKSNLYTINDSKFKLNFFSSIENSFYIISSLKYNSDTLKNSCFSLVLKNDFINDL